MSLLHTLALGWARIVAVLALLAHLALGTPVPPHTAASAQAPLPPQQAVEAGSFPVAPTVTVKATAATSTPAVVKKLPISPTQTKPTALPAVQEQAPTPAPQQTIATTETPDQVNANTRGALVNILCTTKSGGYLHPLSGSGVLIDTDGVILTNSHVAQYFLLKDYPTPGNVDCVVRTGSPATAKYRATLLYLPPAWIAANAQQITSAEPSGSGENDYAFLLINGTTDGSPLPARFPALPITLDVVNRGDPMLLAAYPASYLEGSTIEQNLYTTSAFSPVQEIYTFNDPHQVDVVSVGGTVVSQQGSSGGAMARVQDGALAGIFVTATAGSTTAQRDLHAITLAYIDRSLKAAGKGGLVSLLTGDLASKAADFNANIAPGLTQQLITTLGGK